MKFSKTTALTHRLLVTLALAAASVGGLSGIAEAATCATCHAPTNQSTADFRPVEALAYRNITTGSIKGSHAKHIPAATVDTTKCTPCHGTASASYTTKHRDGFINVTTNTTKSLSYSRTARFLQGGTSSPTTLGTCNTAYCHSSGQAAPVYVPTPTWGTAAGLTCAGCHGDAATLATGAHNKHVGSLGSVGRTVGCVDCHSATASSNTVVSNSANHTNATVNLKFDNSINKDTDAPTYNSVATTAANGAAVAASGTGSCAALYCHSSGNVNNAGSAVAPATYKTIAWNAAAIGCDGCHGDGAGRAHPTYTSGAIASATANSHVKHVESSAFSCDYCHNTTTTNTTIPPTTVTTTGIHLNRSDDVSFKSNGGKTGTYSAAGKTCSATYCHGTGPSIGWGGSTTCVSCHDASSALMLRHDKHYASATAPTVLAGGTDAHTTTAYAYSCLACHPSNQHATGPASAVAPLQDAAVTGTKISAYTKGSASAVDGKGYNYTTNGTCTTVCHTKDGVTAGSAVTAQNWGTTPTGTCGVCHSKAGDASPSWSTPHTKHINTYAANTNISCAACHNGTAASNSALQATAAARNQHPNANRDLAMNTFATGGTVAIAGVQGSQTCSNTYCHSNGTIAAGTHSAVAWSGSMTCASCHGDSASLATGSHSKHLLVSGVTCNSCHNSTASNNTTVSNVSNHVNKSVTINFNASAAPSAGTYNAVAAGGSSVYQKTVGTAAGSCATNTCHGSNSGTWGVANTDSTCVKCHGVAGTSTAAYTADPKTAAPGYNGTGVNTAGTVGTITGGVSADSKVGAHDTHLKGTGGYKTGGVACADCHAVTALGDAGHMNGATTMTWSNLAKNIGTTPYNADKGTIVPGYTAPSCSTNYCHGGGFAAAVQGTGTTVSWVAGTYLANPAATKNATDCNQCHVSPPTASAKFAHTAMTITTDCSSCHAHNGTGANHINGTLEASGGDCNGCHDYDTVGATYSAGKWSAGTWGKAGTNFGAYPTVSEGWGAHNTHIAFIKTRIGNTTGLTAAGQTFGVGEPKNVCGTCHTNTGAHTMSATAGQDPTGRSINFGDSTFNLGGTGLNTLVFGTPNPVYNGVSGTTGQTTNKTCSNLSCHYFITPQWSTY